jgi:hypothetical protein
MRARAPGTTYPVAYPRAEFACSINGHTTAVRAGSADQGGAA